MKNTLVRVSFIVITVVVALGITQMVGSTAEVDLDLSGTESSIQLIDTGEEFIITAGPAHLAVPMEMEGHAHEGVLVPIDSVTIPADVYLYGLSYEIVDGEGNQLPGEILHHFNLIDPASRELFLPISRRLYAAGGETGEQTMPWLLFGHPLHAGQQIVVSVMLHNPTGVEHEGVHLVIHLKYVKSGRPWPFFSIYPFQVDVAFPAGDKSFVLPRGISSQSWEGSPSVEGKLMIVGSHFHNYATSIVFEDVTEGEVIWEGFPVEESGELSGATIGHLYRTGGTRIYPDHVYRATVYYDNPTEESITEGGMGVVAGAFSIDGDAEWPEVDPLDPLYLLDRAHFLREWRGTLESLSEEGSDMDSMEHEEGHDMDAMNHAQGGHDMDR